MGRTSRKRQRKRFIFVNENRSNDTTIERLKAWIFQNYSPICDLVPYNFHSTGTGLKTLKDIDINEILIKLPLQCLITTTTVSESHVATLFKDDETYTAQCVLSIFLIYEAHLGEESKWYPYISSIPRTFTSPEFCTKNEKAVLPPFIFNHFCKAHNLQSEFALIAKSLRSLDNTGKSYCSHCNVSFKEIITFQKYQWAYYSVNTRTVYLNFRKQLQSNCCGPLKITQPNNLALAPYLDLLNHDVDASVKVSIVTDSGQNKFYQITTCKSFTRDTQVFISYGSHSNLKLYVDYGFFIPNNPIDEVYFDLADVQKCTPILDSASEFVVTNRFDKNLAFTVNGLNYNATIALYMFTTKLPKAHWNMKIFGGYLNSNDLYDVYKLGMQILMLKRKELDYYFKRMQCIKRKTESFSIAIDLLQEYIRILNVSSKFLKL